MLKKMVVNIGGVSAVFALIMVLAALSSILLARILTPNDFGEFVHMRYLILLIPPLCIWGQGIAIARFFSKNEVGQYKWGRAFFNIMIVSTLLSLLGVVISHLIYDMQIYKSAGLFIASIFYCITLLFSHLQRSQGRYKQAIMMFSGFRGVFFIFLIFIYLFGTLTKYSAIYSYVGVIILVGLVSWWYTLKTIPQGVQNVPNEMHTSGILFMGIDMSVIIMASLDGLFIKSLLGNELLALYAAALGPGQVFKILNRSAKYVWVPEFGRHKKVMFKK
ncbi:oligosaccharide flippase family protein, partial [candidate division KSB1 bacterium]|nr:oligosaccharide flippase family protein [candidate division KSB1 bacterium]